MLERTKLIENNAYIESCVAITLATKPDLFPIVKKFSNVILGILKNPQKRQIILNKLAIDDNFKNLKSELYVVADYEKKIFKGPLGSLRPNKSLHLITPQEALNDIEDALNYQESLIPVMALHSVFGYRIARLLEPEAFNNGSDNFSSFKKSLETMKKECLIRKAEDENITATIQLGICVSEKNLKKINELKATKKLCQSIPVLEHRNSLQRFGINQSTNKFQDFINHNLPLIAGPSSHVISLFTAAYIYKNCGLIDFNNDELLEYALAYFTYLTTAGYHGFHEVMYSATVSLKLSYDLITHLANIPKANFELFETFRSLFERFSNEIKQETFDHAIKKKIEEQKVTADDSNTLPNSSEIESDDLYQQFNFTTK